MEKEKIAEIPFWVYDRPKWISGITPSTSCEDILRSLASFLQPEFDSNRKSAKLILTEKWRDVERPLAYDAKILKVPFIYYVSNFIAQKLIWLPNFLTNTLFVTSKIEFSNLPILQSSNPPIFEFKVLQNAFRIKKNKN